MAARLAWAVLLAAGAVDAARNESASPHIIFAIVDDLGYGDVGYNNKELHAATPTMNKLASGGVTLSSFYASPTCTASRAALFTGKYPMHLGLQDSVIHPSEPRGVPLKETFLSSKLKDAGYGTVFVGKWHLGFHQYAYTPTQRGFDEFFGILTGGGDHESHESTETFAMRGKDYKAKTITQTGSNLWHNSRPVLESDDGISGSHSTHLYTRKALEYVEAYAAHDLQPLHLVLSYQAVHAPIQVPAEYTDGTSYDNGCEAIKAGSASQTRLRKQMCGMVSMVDESLDELHASLRDQHMWENTVLFFLSDNGGITRHGSSNGDLRGEKGSYYEGGIRVPAFVAGGVVARAVGDVDAARVFAGLVHITDLHATALRIAGITDRSSKKPPPSSQSAAATRRLQGAPPSEGGGGAFASTALDEVAAHEHYTDSLDGVDQWDALTTGTTAAASQRTHVAHNINSELFGAAGALRVGEYKLIVEARVTESEIYEYGQHMLQDDDWDQAELTQVIHQKLLRTPGATSLFDVVANPNELDEEDCADPPSCANLYDRDDYADIQAAILAKWAELRDSTPESTEIWLDDGPLADPALFGGVWTPWRDDLGMPYATYELATKTVHNTLGGDNKPKPAEAADDADSSRRRLGSAGDAPSRAPGLLLALGVGFLAGRLRLPHRSV